MNNLPELVERASWYALAVLLAAVVLAQVAIRMGVKLP